jgi:hypothetical protein
MVTGPPACCLIGMPHAAPAAWIDGRSSDLSRLNDREFIADPHSEPHVQRLGRTREPLGGPVETARACRQHLLPVDDRALLRRSRRCSFRARRPCESDHGGYGHDYQAPNQCARPFGLRGLKEREPDPPP